jgi:hypothetical protein
MWLSRLEPRLDTLDASLVGVLERVLYGLTALQMQKSSQHLG